MSPGDPRHELTAAVLLLVACGHKPTGGDPSSPTIAPPTFASAPHEPPSASASAAPAASISASGTPPIGSPRFCPGDDATGMPLANSSFASQLPVAEARAELDIMNETCGDSWCEGSFEWFFYDLRGDEEKTEFTMRVYDEQKAPKDADASKIVVKGPGFVGRVVGQKSVPACTTPCTGFATPPRWAPCITLDLRCEVDAPWGGFERPWSRPLHECGDALERAVREIHPE